MTLDHSANAGRHAFSERGNDLYETPPEAVDALLKAETLPKDIWEPACGPGAIVGVLRAAGHRVLATDLVGYDCPESEGGMDFLTRVPWPHPDCIVTNPPYKLAGQFVIRGLALCSKVIMLLRLPFLEGVRRTDILESGHLARVHVFRNRLPMMHRAGWEGNKAGSSMAFAWFVWDQMYHGPTELRRISWHPRSPLAPPSDT